MLFSVDSLWENMKKGKLSLGWISFLYIYTCDVILSKVNRSMQKTNISTIGRVPIVRTAVVLENKVLILRQPALTVTGHFQHLFTSKRWTSERARERERQQERQKTEENRSLPEAEKWLLTHGWTWYSGCCIDIPSTIR